VVERVAIAATADAVDGAIVVRVTYPAALQPAQFVATAEGPMQALLYERSHDCGDERCTVELARADVVGGLFRIDVVLAYVRGRHLAEPQDLSLRCGSKCFVLSIVIIIYFSLMTLFDPKLTDFAALLCHTSAPALTTCPLLFLLPQSPQPSHHVPLFLISLPLRKQIATASAMLSSGTGFSTESMASRL
jgi:hypothetical protein